MVPISLDEEFFQAALTGQTVPDSLLQCPTEPSAPTLNLSHFSAGCLLSKGKVYYHTEDRKYFLCFGFKTYAALGVECKVYQSGDQAAVNFVWSRVRCLRVFLPQGSLVQQFLQALC